MGLSRNKVAVSEGAAGSPPFYGECEISLTDISYLQIGKKTNQKKRKDDESESAVLRKQRFTCCSIFSNRFTEKENDDTQTGWGCSSAGRAPALQAGGHGFDSHHLHQRYMREPQEITIVAHSSGG